MVEKKVSKNDEHGTGAVPHPNFENRDIYSAAELGAPIVDFSKSTGLPESPDTEQGSSSSCTVHSDFGYIWQLTGGMRLMREDTYSHVRLPGGGAYLTAPGNLHLNYGVLQESDKYPDPNPETEANMSKIILALDANGRTHAFTFKILTIQADINTIGSILEQYKGCIIGINGNNAGWANMVDPSFNGKAVWGHALYVFDRAVRKGKNALVAKSSWCSTGVTTHFINSTYFANGGVFEAIVYANFKEISMENQTKVVLGKDGKTIYLATPIAMDWPNFVKQASVEGITVPAQGMPPMQASEL